MPIWIRHHRRKIAVLSAVLIFILLGLTGVLSTGVTIFSSLMALTFLYKLRQHGTYKVNQFTTPAEVAVQTGAAAGGASHANHVGYCGDGNC